MIDTFAGAGGLPDERSQRFDRGVDRNFTGLDFVFFLAGRFLGMRLFLISTGGGFELGIESTLDDSMIGFSSHSLVHSCASFVRLGFNFPSIH